MRWIIWLLLLGVAAGAGPAFAEEQYLINLPNAGEFYSSAPFRQDAVTSFPISNGTGTYAGHAFAGPGWVTSFGRVDAEWTSGLSGGGGGVSRSRAQTDDFVISGPPGYVTGTLHWHVNATLGRDGGFVGHGAHQALLVVSASINFLVVNGSVTYSNAGLFADGVLTGYASPDVDAPISITADFPVGVPLLVYMYLDAGGFTYGNSSVSPGWVECDAGGMSDSYAGNNLRLEEVGGQVMTLPGGYTLNAPSWSIVDNHFTNTTSVGSESQAAMRFDLASANPTHRQMRMTLALEQGGDAHVVVFDVSGREVKTLLNDRLGAGIHPITWDGRDERGLLAPAGQYFARANLQGHVLTRRFVVLR